MGREDEGGGEREGEGERVIPVIVLGSKCMALHFPVFIE